MIPTLILISMLVFTIVVGLITDRIVEPRLGKYTGDYELDGQPADVVLRRADRGHTDQAALTSGRVRHVGRARNAARILSDAAASVNRYPDFGSVRLVNALADEAKVDQLHACGGNARCTTCRVEFIEGEPEQLARAMLEQAPESIRRQFAA